MLGAIAGDVIGSIYEFKNIKRTDFPLFDPRCRFTDDTVLTVATARAILEDGDYQYAYLQYFRRYPDAGYGGRFLTWATEDDPQPYSSFGNGSAMRVSPVAYANNTLEAVLHEAERSASVTHNHPEGIKGAQSTASAIFLARTGKSKAEIKSYIEEKFEYNLDFTLDEIRPTYRFNVTCQGSVPQAIRAFLESNDYEDAVRKAISIGGDSDTIACVTGSIAEAFYGGVPPAIAEQALQVVDDRMLPVITRFRETFRCP